MTKVWKLVQGTAYEDSGASSYFSSIEKARLAMGRHLQATYEQGWIKYEPDYYKAGYEFITIEEHEVL